jgi:NAD(P)H dehydrogenase (quinone)
MAKILPNSSQVRPAKDRAKYFQPHRQGPPPATCQAPRRDGKSPWLGLVLALILPCLRGNAAPDQAAQPRSTEPSRVLVVYYSLSGNTEQMAAGVVEGAKRVGGVVVDLKKVDDVSKADLENAEAIVLGCPTYYGNIPGKMKVALDDWSWKMKVDFTDKVGGAFSTGGGQVGGKEFVVMSLLVFMLQNRMVVAGPLYQNDKTGSVWGELGASAMTGPLDPGVGKGELDSAQRLGERVARLARKLKGNRQ